MTRGQLFYFFFNYIKKLCLLEPSIRGVVGERLCFDLDRFQRIVIVFVVRTESGEQGRPERADLAAAVVVPDGVLHDALEQ